MEFSFTKYLDVPSSLKHAGKTLLKSCEQSIVPSLLAIFCRTIGLGCWPVFFSYGVGLTCTHSIVKFSLQEELFLPIQNAAQRFDDANSKFGLIALGVTIIASFFFPLLSSCVAFFLGVHHHLVTLKDQAYE